MSSTGELILENAKIYNVDKDLLDQIFDFMVRSFSKYALQIYHKPSSTEKQMELCMKMIASPPSTNALPAGAQQPRLCAEGHLRDESVGQPAVDRGRIHPEKVRR